MSLSPGTRMGPYEILAALGAGGMGEVYRAKDPRLDRTVAVKVLRQHLSSSPEGRQALRAGGQDDLAALSHPVCHTFATLVIGESPGQRENAVLTRVS
jgi:serine/threonine protein kinase